jgi:hypothetical protein
MLYVSLWKWNALLSNYQETYQLFAILGVIIGSAWAITTWVHQERIRKEKDVPGFECQIQCSQSILHDGRILITIDVVTMNTGNIPIWPEINKASISVKAIDLPSIPQFLEKNDEQPDAVQLIAPNLSELCLEPHTRTIFSAFYIATNHQLYSIQFYMPSSHTTKDGKKWHWSQRRMVYISEVSTKGGISD